MPTIANLRRWRNGEIFSARDYVYERDTIIAQVNRLSALLEGTGTAVDLTVDTLTANEIVLNGADLNDYVRGIAVYTGDEPTDRESGDIWFDQTI